MLENWKNKFLSFLALLRNITNDVIKKEAGGCSENKLKQ